MSRISSIFDDADADGILDGGEDINASYKYLGAGTIVEEDYEDIEVKLSYLDGAGDITGFDRFGRVAEQIWSDYGASQTLDEYTYTYDRAGNRTAKVNSQHTDFNETYTYDDLDRLTDADRADSFDQSWTLDGEGNFSTFNDDGTSQDRTTNAANEITDITGSWADPTYDAAGNVISGPKSGSETTRLHYVYDAWNRQVAIYTDDGDGVFEPSTDDTLIAEYEYDGQKHRIEKTFADDTSVEYYYNQDWQLLEECFLDEYEATTTVNQYVWSQRYIDAPIVRLHDGNVDGDCNPTTDANDTIRYYSTEANHNVTTTITDGYSSDVVEHYVYTAYGKVTVYDENWSNSASHTEDGPLYCGYFFDANTANYLARNRFYNSSLATWLSRDPIGYDARDMNLYRYVGNKPTNVTDPNGLDKPGCDLPEWVGADDSECMLACCAQHDKYKCTYASWGWNVGGVVAGACIGGFASGGLGAMSGGSTGASIAGLISDCAECNNEVVKCIAECAIDTNHMAGQPLYFCANGPNAGRFITIGPGLDYDDLPAARKDCGEDQPLDKNNSACCRFQDNGYSWTETVRRTQGQTSQAACAKRADGWFSDWIVISAQAGKCAVDIKR